MLYILDIFISLFKVNYILNTVESNYFFLFLYIYIDDNYKTHLINYLLLSLLSFYFYE